MKVVLHNGDEDLTGWINPDQLAKAMKLAKGLARGGTFWLLERNVVCLDCADREQVILEYPLAIGESSRCRPHDSRYLVAAGVRNRSQVFRP